MVPTAIQERIIPMLGASKLDSAILSAELRDGRHGYLEQRRAVAALSLGAIGALGVVSLYQVGLLRRLPDPPLPYFDASVVAAAPEAYAKLAMPNGVLGLGSYAVTLALAATGGRARARHRPWLPLLLAAKVFALDLPQAALRTRAQWTRHRAFSVWSLAATTATAASIPLVIPEAVAAVRQLAQALARR